MRYKVIVATQSQRHFVCFLVLCMLLAGSGLLAHATQSLTLTNTFGLQYATQPVEVPLSSQATNENAVLNESGNIIGQISTDKLRAILRADFTGGQASRTFSVTNVADPRAGVVHPVTVTTQTLGTTDTVMPNGVDTFYEITNGLCGVRVPKTLKAGALTTTPWRVPTPVIGVQYPDGEWAGRPDFRSLVVPASDSWGNTRTAWSFTSFSSQLVEDGPFQTTVRLSIGTNQPEHPDPYIYEITLYADEQFVKIAQKTGRVNDWFLDLNLFKPTPWRATRWRSGSNSTWLNAPEYTQGVTLPDHPGESYDIMWPSGPGPTIPHHVLSFYGEGEGNLFEHDAWAEFIPGITLGRYYLAFHHSGGLLTRYCLLLGGIQPWQEWNRVGDAIYAFNAGGAGASPVAGLLNGASGEITGWNGTYGPGEAQFTQHLPAWLDGCTFGPGNYYVSEPIVRYLENYSYQGITNRTSPVLGIKFTMNMTSGSYFVWLGQNSDIEPNVNNLTLEYRSKPWDDWSRYACGAARIEDAQSYGSTWPDPPGMDGQWTYPEIVEKNKQLARQNLVDMGDWDFLAYWRTVLAADKRQLVTNYLTQRIPVLTALLEKARTHDYKSSYALMQYTYERYASSDFNIIDSYLGSGKQSNGGVLTDQQYADIKKLLSFHLHHVFDEDRICYWNAGTNVGHGGGTMEADINAARFAGIVRYPTWTDTAQYLDRPNSQTLIQLTNDIGRFGAQNTSTGYATLAGITPTLADLQSLQYKSYTNPASFTDEYARDPRLRNYAYFLLNRTGVKDPRYLNVRSPIAVGNGGAGNGHPAVAILSGTFRYLDPLLSQYLMWAWTENGQSTYLTPPLPKMVDYQTKQTPYPFPKLANFPGNMTMHRAWPHTPFETGVWITNGSFFNQHRSGSGSGAVHIDALGKPLVTKETTYGTAWSAAEGNPLYANVVSPAMSTWNADGFDSTLYDPWSLYNDTVAATGELRYGSYSKSTLYSASQNESWDRQICQLSVDPEAPVIYIRDTGNQDGPYMSTFWLQTEGAVTLPDSTQSTPAFRDGCDLVTGPSALQVGALAAGRNTFTFRGHDWMNLYPLTYQAHGITDVGPSVDVDIHNISDTPTEAVLGHWRIPDFSMPDDADSERFNDRQYVRVKFPGRTNVTLFTPYIRDQKPANYSVTKTGTDTVQISYTVDGVPRVITITPTGYTATKNGVEIANETFPTTVARTLYPGSDDLPYADNPQGDLRKGSDISRVTVTGAPAWANGDYERVPAKYVSQMLTDRDGVHHPFARYQSGTPVIDTNKPCFRGYTVNTTTWKKQYHATYLFALQGSGYYLARLPGTVGSATEEWLFEPAGVLGMDPPSVLAWRSATTDYSGGMTSTPVAGITIAWANNVTHTPDTIAPGAPVLQSPANSANVATDYPMFTWGPVNDPSGILRYEVDIDTVIYSAGTVCTYTPLVGLNVSGHTWRVRVVDGAGNAGAWSDSRTFTVTQAVGGTVATPTFSPPPIVRSIAQYVTISCASPYATIRYTTDGSTPSPTNGTLYTGEWVTISSTTTLKAIAYQNNMTDSAIASGTYTIADFPTDLIAYWMCDENGGTRLLDATAAEHDGTVNNGDWSAGCAGGYALNCSGVASYVSVQQSSALSPASFSCALWLNVPPGGGGPILGNLGHSALSTSSATTYAAGGNDTLNYSWPQDGRWHHYAMTYDATTGMKSIYCDGDLLASRQCNGALQIATGQMLLGAHYTTGSYLNGQLDHIRLYNRAISPSEVQALMAIVEPVGYWTLNEGTGTVLGDSSVNNTPGALGTASWTTGQMSNAISCASGTATVAHHSAHNVTDAMTVSLWVMIPTGGLSRTSNAWILDKRGKFLLAFDAADGHIIKFQANGTTQATYNTTALTEGAWYHLAVSYDALTGQKVYLNGTELSRSSGSLITGNLAGSTEPMVLGAGGGGYSWARYSGGIDQLRLYNYALTQNAIQAVMASETPPDPLAPVGYWTLDEGAGTTLGDSSYNNTPGALGTASWTTGQMSNAISCASGTATVAHHSAHNVTDAMTVSLWVMIPTEGLSRTSNAWILDKPGKFNLSFDAQNGSLIKFQANGLWSKFSTDSLADGTWHHLAVSYDAVTGQQVYLDGTALTRTSGSLITGDLASSTQSMVLGAGEGYSWARYSGGIDQLRLYNYTLTQNAIQGVMASEIP